MYKQIILSLILFFKINYLKTIEFEKFKKICLMIENHNIEQSFLEIKKYQSLDSKLSPEIQILLGKIYLELKQPEKSSNYFEKVLFSSQN